MPLRFEDGNSCTQMRRSVIEKLRHEGMPFERLLDDAALNAHAPAMDEPHVAQTSGVCFIQILFDDGRDVPRGERVKIENTADGNPQGCTRSIVEGVLILHGQLVAGFS
jgi:hypothetical protein